jgi:hypothetical protein
MTAIREPYTEHRQRQIWKRSIAGGRPTAIQPAIGSGVPGVAAVHKQRLVNVRFAPKSGHSSAH